MKFVKCAPPAVPEFPYSNQVVDCTTTELISCFGSYEWEPATVGIDCNGPNPNGDQTYKCGPAYTVFCNLGQVTVFRNFALCGKQFGCMLVTDGAGNYGCVRSGTDRQTTTGVNGNTCVLTVDQSCNQGP